MKTTWKRLLEYFLNWTGDEYTAPKVKEGEKWFIEYCHEVRQINIVYVGELIITYDHMWHGRELSRETQLKTKINFIERIND